MELNTKIKETVRWTLHEQPKYIWISEPGQPFLSEFVLYRPVIG